MRRALPVPDVALRAPLMDRPTRPRPRAAAAAPGVAGHPPPRRAPAGRLPHPRSTASGIDFADLRAYTPEDDVRHIDWNVTARLDEPYVRQYTEDRELTAWLLLDRSRVDGFGSPRAAARTSCSTELAVTLARLLARGGNRVGAILYDNHVERMIPPRTRPQPGAAAGARAHRAGPRRPTPARPPTSPALLHAAAGDDPPPVARLRRLRLHQRAAAGSARWPCSPTATRWWRSGWSTRSSASCPTSA